MNAPLVSIVINNHNYARFVGAAIDSALAQHYPRCEVVVVDDGSTDESPRIIRGFGDRVRTRFKPNGGQTSALNAGLNACRGEVFIFLDADDLLLPGAASAAAGRFADSKIVKVHWPLWVIDSEGNRTGERKPTEPPPAGDLTDLVRAHGPEHASWPPTSGNAYARRYLERVFPLPEIERECGVGSANADKYLTMLTPFFGQVAAIDEPLSCYRVHGANDHSCLAFDRRLRRDVTIFECYSRILEDYFRESGAAADPQRWRDNSWSHRLLRSIDEISAHVPQGEPFILIDDGCWELPSTPQRPVIPFTERDGVYAGPPEDDDAASHELDRLTAAGARFLVLAWPALWWREHYPGFWSRVDATHRLVVSNDRIHLYELVAAAPSPSSRGEERLGASR